MQKMRDVSPFLLTAIAVLFILFMVISDANLPDIFRGGKTGGLGKEAIGSVNGEEIKYVDFEGRVKEAVEQQRSQAKGEDIDIDEAPIREQIWSQMVDEIILNQKAKELGITISKEEVLDVMLENPPDYMKRPFSDSTGAFNKQAYLDLVTNPDKLAERINPESGVDPKKAVSDFKRDLLKVEEYIRKSHLQEHLQTAVAASVTLIPPSAIERKYTVDNSSVSVDFISMGINSIKDEDVKIDDKDIEAYYEKNKQFYKQKPARKLKYTVFPIRPSDKDSARTKKKIETLANALNSAQSVQAKDSIFEIHIPEFGGKTSAFANLKDIDPERLGLLASLEEHATIGPITMRDGTYFFRLDGRRKDSNTVVRASHILINFNNNKDSAKLEANKIYNLVKKGSDFGELATKYSQDKGSAQRGGDVDYFGKGRMVKPFEEAAFGASVGSIVGPIESQFGFHIIKVTDKKSEEIKYSEIKLSISISNSTKNSLFRDAFSIKQLVENGKLFDSVVAQNKKIASETALFERKTPILSSRALTNFAFENNVGTVSDPMDIKNTGIVVAQISEARIAGIKTLKDMKDEIKGKLIRIKKLDLVKQKMDQLYAKVSSLDSLKKAKGMDSTLDIKSAVVKDNGSVTGLGQEAALTSKIMMLSSGKISEPIRGDRAYFITQVTQKTNADMSKLEEQRSSILQSEISRVKGSAYYKWLNEIKDHSTIIDNRSKFYKN